MPCNLNPDASRAPTRPGLLRTSISPGGRRRRRRASTGQAVTAAAAASFKARCQFRTHRLPSEAFLPTAHCLPGAALHSALRRRQGAEGPPQGCHASRMARPLECMSRARHSLAHFNITVLRGPSCAPARLDTFPGDWSSRETERERGPGTRGPGGRQGRRETHLESSNSTKANGGPRRFFRSMNTILPNL